MKIKSEMDELSEYWRDRFNHLCCLYELCLIPKHIEEQCGSNDCPKCEWEYHAKEYITKYDHLNWMEEYFDT